MIFGIGNDIVSVERIKNIFLSETRLERVFSNKEIEYCKNNYEKLAARFAAKEAIVKAIGTGFNNLSLNKIEVLNDELGKPYYSKETIEYIIKNTCNEILNKIKLDNISIFLSLSHEREFALATCILEINNEK